MTRRLALCLCAYLDIGEPRSPHKKDWLSGAHLEVKGEFHRTGVQNSSGAVVEMSPLVFNDAE